MKRIGTTFFAAILIIMLLVPMMATSVSADSAVWDGKIATTFAGGSGTKEDPYKISAANQLAYLAEQVNNGQTYQGSYFVLTTDLVFNNNSSDYTKWIVKSSAPTNNWIPIGSTSTNCFSGIFDGANHTIKGMYVLNEKSYAGVFGYVKGTVKNLHVAESFFESPKYTAAIAGYFNGAKVYNCSTSAIVNSAGENAGGIAGRLVASTMEKCVNTGSVTTAAQYAGGLAGCIGGDASIKYSYNTGTVEAGDNAGGLVGLSGSDKGSGTITDSYNTGAVSGGKSVGGIVGKAGHAIGGEIKNNYNTGKITATDELYVGGVVGYIGLFIDISNNYYDSTTAKQGVGINDSPIIADPASTCKPLSLSDMTGASALSKLAFTSDAWIAAASSTPQLKAFQAGYVDKDPNEAGADTTAADTTTAKPSDTTKSSTTTKATTTKATTTKTTGTAAVTNEPADSNSSMTWLYVVIGVVVAAGIGVAIFFITKKKASKS